MTDKMISSAEQRAQIFALLRSNAPDEVEPVRPTYLDDSIADIMIGRAMSSFKAPFPAPDAIANQASYGHSEQTLRIAGSSTERFAS